MNSPSYTGAFTALVTPFSQGKVDEAQFRELIDRQFELGIDGVVPVGTTGESPTLETDEHIRVIEIAIEQTANRGVVMAGTGANSTAEAIALTQAAEKVGAKTSLQVTPYYNKPSQEGLFQHFRAIAESTSMELILYSIPGRCGIPIGVETTERLAKACPNIVGIKEAGGSVERVSQLRQVLPDDFVILSGDDSLTLPFVSAGARGVVSVASNLVPAEVTALAHAAVEGRSGEAQALHETFYPLFNALLTLDTNPVPIKTALELAQVSPAEFRLPLVPMAAQQRSQLETVMQSLQLLA
ncbi:MAG: 4-hydroxy-tetrahydrodipicolinate synthase [Verrucomicrobiota bacterium]